MVSITKKELKEIKSLRTVKGRRVHGRFVAEGVRLLEEAMRHRVGPRLLLTAKPLLTDRASALVGRFRAKRIPLASTSAREMKATCDSVTSQGLLGVFDMMEWSPTELLKPRYRKVLLCDGISDPGNLGTLIRCALAFGFNPLLLVGACADPFAPKVVRASAGTIFGVKLIRTTATQAAQLSAEGEFTLVAADVNGRSTAGPPVNAKRNRVILAVGSEAVGLSEPIANTANCRWQLKHESSVESLNVAVAAALMMKQFYDQVEGK
ncbi:MAG: RNA methyltransferase [candidate division Zixibacteria bacterium]|nr:RNA methyltransferase [candidate division Zixibacteria bacterium]MDH3936165.1 RNA methyltransferase [candidate division Zixibacteria bacterium]MDH4032983.1 RNA methyltransferase [candidate division Zixibacteria bacterium]